MGDIELMQRNFQTRVTALPPNIARNTEIFLSSACTCARISVINLRFHEKDEKPMMFINPHKSQKSVLLGSKM